VVCATVPNATTTLGGDDVCAQRKTNPRLTARQQAYVLRASTRWLSSSKRERGCGFFCVEHVDQEPAIVIKRERGVISARWHGLMTCGHIWTCPVCSQNLRAKRAELLAAGVRGLGGRWVMVTITLRHREGMALKELLRGMMKAWRRARQGGRIQRVWTERVTASARATEITYGENGWHPHLHVVLRTTQWTRDERDALLDRWRSAIVGELGPHVTPDDQWAIHWSSDWDASAAERREHYLTKMGLELTGLGKKSRGGHYTHWEVARQAGAGDQKAIRLWLEFCAATKGRRMVELDDRLSDAGKAQLEREASQDVVSDEGGEPQTVAVTRDDVRALRRLERRIPTIFCDVLQLAEGRDVKAIRQWIAYARERGPPHAVRYEH